MRAFSAENRRLTAALGLPMRETLRVWLVVTLICSSELAFAEEPSPPEEKGFMRSTAGMILIGEGLFAVNAGMAMLDPQAYGILGALLFPLGAAESRSSKTTMWVGLAAAEGLAAYNIAELDKDEDTDKEIFVANMIAWHVFTGVVGTTAWLKGDLDEPAKVTFRYVPHRDGGMLKVAYAF